LNSTDRINYYKNIISKQKQFNRDSAILPHLLLLIREDDDDDEDEKNKKNKMMKMNMKMRMKMKKIT